MLAIERRNEILAVLQEKKKVVVSELSEYYGVTEETIRRDLEKLENDGLAKKTYGGAVLNESLNTDLPYTVRKKANVSGKQKIGELMAEMITDGNHIILDASSTALFVAKSIKNRKNITVITNSLEILIELSDRKGWNVFCTGGTMKGGALSLIGAQTARMLDLYNGDMAIISGKGIDMDHGITDSNESDALVKMAMLKAGKRKIFALDSSKFDKVSFAKIGDLNEADVIVTDIRPSDEWMAKFARYGIEVIYPREY